MQSSFFRLGLGMIFAVVLVYLLMTVNFQSWLDPFIILMALPGALAGILAFIAMYCLGSDIYFVQVLNHLIGAMLGAGKYQHTGNSFIAEHKLQQ